MPFGRGEEGNCYLCHGDRLCLNIHVHAPLDMIVPLRLAEGDWGRSATFTPPTGGRYCDVVIFGPFLCPPPGPIRDDFSRSRSIMKKTADSSTLFLLLTSRTVSLVRLANSVTPQLIQSMCVSPNLTPATYHYPAERVVDLSVPLPTPLALYVCFISRAFSDNYTLSV